MDWLYVLENQAISFNTLQSAVSVYNIFIPKLSQNSSLECLNKTKADAYVRIDTNWYLYSMKEPNQIVVKRDLIPVAECGVDTGNYQGLDNISFYLGTNPGTVLINFQGDPNTNYTVSYPSTGTGPVIASGTTDAGGTGTILFAFQYDSLSGSNVLLSKSTEIPM